MGNDYNTPAQRVSGVLTAPAAGAVIADTGQLAAGNYEVDAELASTDTAAVGKFVELQHRNAGNTATLFSARIPVPFAMPFSWKKISLAVNERVRAVAGAAGAASSTYAAHIIARPW